jgi:hypothetical protein
VIVRRSLRQYSRRKFEVWMEEDKSRFQCVELFDSSAVYGHVIITCVSTGYDEVEGKRKWFMFLSSST